MDAVRAAAQLFSEEWLREQAARAWSSGFQAGVSAGLCAAVVGLAIASLTAMFLTRNGRS
jgi:hypothetical protein